jgi:hypothetical protein
MRAFASGVAAVRELLSFAALLVFATASSAAGVDIRIDPASIVSPPDGAPSVEIRFSDIRETVLVRSVANISEVITLEPSEPELVRAIVTAKTGAFLKANPGRTVPQVIYCGLRKFVLATPSTLLHADIKVTIEIVLRVGQQDRVVAGEAGDRSYVGATHRQIEKVIRQALAGVADGIDPALTSLLATPVVSSPP